MPDLALSASCRFAPGLRYGWMGTTGRLCLLMLLAGLLWHPVCAPSAPVDSETTGQLFHCRPGPWGELEYARIVIEPPDEFMAADYGASPPRWCFPGYDSAGLEPIWHEAGLDQDQLAALRDPAIREQTADGVVLRPTSELLAGLRARSREVIYNSLARLPGNPLQNEPFRFRADMVDEWFGDSDLGVEVNALIRSLLYRRGNSVIFSDPGLVLPLLPTAGERVHLIKTLARKSTLLLKLRITPASDLETIAEYWSNGRRRKDVKPLLQSLARHPGGMTLDVAHLLPRLARGLLYTYPSPDVPLSQSPDCHWTAMNFFNDPPEPRFGDIDYLRQILTSTYAPVSGDPLMGDLLLLTEPDGNVIHSCVYIADDIVFTKNGQSASIPWTLSTLPDLQAFYPAHSQLQIRVFRKKT